MVFKDERGLLFSNWSESLMPSLPRTSKNCTVRF
jgi:hypothetical protein